MLQRGHLAGNESPALLCAGPEKLGFFPSPGPHLAPRPGCGTALGDLVCWFSRATSNNRRTVEDLAAGTLGTPGEPGRG